MDDNNLSAPEWCLGCPHPIYDGRLREVKGGSPQEILAAHHEVLKDDPQRLSAEFITALARMPRGGADRG